MFNSLPLTRIKIAIAKIIYKLLRLLGTNNKQLVVRNGIKYDLDLAEGIDLSVFIFGSFQSHVTGKKLQGVKDGDTILDIGANIGVMALSFAQTYPNSKVYGFEPTHYALEKCRINLGLNPELASRIELVQCFLSDTTSDNPDIKAFSSWRLDGKNEQNGAIHPTHLGTAMNSGGTPSYMLDEWVQAKGLQSIGLIKIDTDGHEYKILKGAKQTMEKYRPTLIFEIGQYVMVEHNIGFDFYADYFNGLNYKMYNADNMHEITLINYKSEIPENGTIDILAVPQ